MSGLSSVVLVVHILVAMAMVGVILLQRSEGGALGMGGGGSGLGGLFSPRGAADCLTAVLGVVPHAIALIQGAPSDHPPST